MRPRSLLTESLHPEKPQYSICWLSWVSPGSLRAWMELPIARVQRLCWSSCQLGWPAKLSCPCQILQTRPHQVLPLAVGVRWVMIPGRQHKWFIRTRVTVTQVGQEHGAAGLPLKSLVLPWGPRTQPLLFLCWLTASGSGLLGAEPRQRASLALAVCSGAEVLRAGHLPSAPVLIELES